MTPILIIAIVIIIIVGMFKSPSDNNSRVKSITNSLAQTGSTSISVLMSTAVGINTIEKSITLVSIADQQKLTLKFEDIRDCEILKDGETVFRKSSSRTLGGALVGGLLLGGAGAVVGGLSGKTRGKEQVNSSTLKIYTKDINTPSFSLQIFNKSTPKAMRNLYVDAATKLCDQLAIIVDQNNEQ